MRVLLWSQYFWPEHFHINEVALSLKKAGEDVTVLTGKPNYPEGKLFPGYRIRGIQRESYTDVDVVRIPLAPRGRGSFLRLTLNYLSFIFSGSIFAPLALRGVQYDVVFVYALSPLLQALPAIFFARSRGIPLVLWVQDLWPESLAATGFVKNRWMLKTVEVLVRYIYRRADSILIQSEAFRDPIIRLGGEPQKIHYYPNTAQSGQDKAELVDDCELASQLRKYFSVVFAGNIGTAQSIETIISAAESLQGKSEIRFFIIGSGSREKWLIQEVKRRKLTNVILTGRLPHVKMPEIFAAASALLVTLADSPVLALTIPSKLQAYLAAGRPVIASLNGEGARVVNDAKAGLTCSAGDANALAATVLKLYEFSPDERNRLGVNGRCYFDEHFDPSKRMLELIERFHSISMYRKEKTS